jgi:hypothetical protein
MVRCPVHGDIGPYKGFMNQVAKESVRQLGEHMADAFRKAGFKVKKD